MLAFLSSSSSDKYNNTQYTHTWQVQKKELAKYFKTFMSKIGSDVMGLQKFGNCFIIFVKI